MLVRNRNYIYKHSHITLYIFFKNHTNVYLFTIKRRTSIIASVKKKYDGLNQCITLMKCELIDVEMMVIPDYGYNL